VNVKQLETWYLNHKRDLPFRKNQRPYDIWVSEIMLQQTQVETVIPYFNRFIKVYPTVESLANTSEEELYLVVQGLGYYRRFKHMHQAAKMIVESFNGKIPHTFKDLIALPGIGAYTAGAILSIAYNQPVSATDGNVIRVLSRVHHITADMRHAKNRNVVDTLNQSFIQKSRPAIYTQALMELGALVCRPKKPTCDQCPLADECIAHRLKIEEELPVITKKLKPKQIKYQTFIIVDGQMIYLRKRTERLLEGMYELPQFESDIPFEYDLIQSFGTVKHVFSHIVWKMDVLMVSLRSLPLKDWVKVKRESLDQYPMARAHKKIVQQFLEDHDKKNVVSI